MQYLKARLHSITWLAQGIHEFDFRPADGETWPTAIAGSHIDVVLPNGVMRSYSLTNRPGEDNRFLIGVNRDPASRGGSSYLHEVLRVGQILQVSPPRNSFPLIESAGHSVFIAGGIGVTPLWSMAHRLSELGRSWEFHYSARNQDNAAFVDELVTLAVRTGNKVRLTFDGGINDRMLDIRALVGTCADDAHVYCCGPVPMLQAFEVACSGRDPSTIHREYFAPAQSARADADGEFRVVLSKTQKTIVIEPKTSILDAVLNAGIDVPYSCMAGVCRACETAVISGTPDHRDLALSPQEQACGKTMLICCSRASSEELVLDL